MLLQEVDTFLFLNEDAEFFCCSVLSCLFPTCHSVLSFMHLSPLFPPLNVMSCDYDPYLACMVLMSLQTAEGNSRFLGEKKKKKKTLWVLTPPDSFSQSP